MEEYRMNDHRDEHRMDECHKKRMWKYFGVILATFMGSFLAFYFVANCTVDYLMSHTYMMKKWHKMERAGLNDFDKTDKMLSKDLKDMSKFGGMFQHKSAIDFLKAPDSYKFVVDLTPFQGNSDSVNIETKGNELEISAESSTNKHNSDTYTKMSQTYILSPNAKLEKLSKKKVNNKYIITVPIED